MRLKKPQQPNCTLAKPGAAALGSAKPAHNATRSIWRCIAMVKMMTKATDYYAKYFKTWPKAAPAKPTEAQLATVHALGLRPGKQALANAMYLNTGATSGQVVAVVGAPQLNRMRQLIKQGYVKTVPAPITDAGHMVYRIALTAKGQAKVGKATATAEAPAQAPAKPRKPRQAKPAQAVTEAAPAEATAPAEAPAADSQPQG